MQVLLWSIVLGLALVALMRSAKVLVSASEDTAKALGWSSLFVGVTIVALGTSLPELATSIWAAWTKNTSLVAANVVGSSIANLLLILGGAGLLAKGLRLDSEEVQGQMSFVLLSTFLLIVTLFDGRFEWMEGLLMLAFFVSFILFNVKEHKEGRFSRLKNWLFQTELSRKMLTLLIGSALAVAGASYLVVHAIEKLTSLTQILPSVIGVSVLAIGTSLPELSTAWIAARKQNTELAIGTLLGSNVFNAGIVLAVPSFVRTLNVTSDILTLGIPFLLIATLLLLFALVQKKLSHYESFGYLLLYALFLFQLFL